MRRLLSGRLLWDRDGELTIDDCHIDDGKLMPHSTERRLEWGVLLGCGADVGGMFEGVALGFPFVPSTLQRMDVGDS